jgi:hypothetical protein
MHKHLNKALWSALLLASPLAGAESQYPAADFQPAIIYQNAELIAKHGQAAKERALAEKAKPAAVKPGPAASEPPAEAKADKAASQGSMTDNLPVIAIALALVGFAFWPGKRSGSEASAAKPARGGFSGGVAGETGVARYLKSLPGNAKSVETKVAKYINSLPDPAKAAQTGVAKYLKSLERA